MNDLRYALRSLRKHPTLTAVALVTLGLGIGANTALFSVVHGVLLQPLPYPDAERIVRVWPEGVFNAEFLDVLRERAPAFEALSIYRSSAFAVSGGGRPEEVRGGRVTPGYFEVLGAPPPTCGPASWPTTSCAPTISASAPPRQPA